MFGLPMARTIMYVSEGKAKVIRSDYLGQGNVPSLMICYANMNLNLSQFLDNYRPSNYLKKLTGEAII